MSAIPSSADVVPPERLPAVLPEATFDSAWTIIGRTYWDTLYNGVDWNAMRDSLRPKAAAAATQGELRQVLQTLVLSLGQSHFSIFPAEVSDVAVGSTGEGSTNGDIGLDVRWVDSSIVVLRVDSAGPAARSGIRAGWTIDAVDGDTVGTRIRRLPESVDPRRVGLLAYSITTDALRGDVGSTVRVDARGPDNEPRQLTVERAPIKGSMVKFGNLPPLAANLEWERRSVAGKDIGIIRFNIWMTALSRPFDIAIDSLRSSDAIILDLRGNLGGVVGMTMGVGGHFMDSIQPVGVMKQRGQDLNFRTNPRRVSTSNQRVTPFAGPVAIVQDEISISATEIFAGGMQAIGRMRVFGSQSAGQSLPSVARRLPNGDILYHAIADFFSPSGDRLEGAGVTPDVPVTVTRGALVAGDPALDAALAWAASATGPVVRP